jgi:DNA primase
MDFVEQLKSSIDIVKVIGEYVQLKRSGAGGRYVGLCPFHQEKTPSFSVNQTRQFYKCFGCGKGGDALTFVKEIEALTFPETLKTLSERYGIPMPKRNDYGDAESKMRAALHEIHAITASFYQSNLRGSHGADARAYLARRGVSEAMIEAFGLGFADASGQSLVRRLAQEQFTPAEIDASALVRRREDGSGSYDFFRGRLMFPIHSESGKVIAFGGRAMRDEDQPKYLNSGETPIYRKSSVLYNVNRARDAMRKSKRAILVEGYMDAIGVYAAGIKEVIAPCGTSLTNLQVRMIHRLTEGGTVVVNFDPDAAGANAAEKAVQLLLDESLHVRVLYLDGGLDPDEYIKQNGAELYRTKLDQASGYFHWLADRARARFDMRSADGRMDAFKFLLPSVNKISDRLERAAIAGDLAGYLGVDPGLVLEQFKRAAAERRTPVAVAAPVVSIPPIERMLLSALLASDAARDEILPRLSPETTSQFSTSEIFEALRHAENSTFSALEGRLSASSRDLLHVLLSADERIDDAVALEQAQACLRRLEADRLKKRIGDLRAKVKEAERAGRMDEAFGIIAELERIRKDTMEAGGE